MIGIWLFVGFFLLVGSIYDIRTFRLPSWLLLTGILGSVISAGYLFLSGQREWLEIFWALLPGGVSLLLSCVTGEQIGYGDGLVLLVLGGCLGLQEVLWIGMAGLFGSFIVSIVLLVSHRATKNRRLPFVPFLCLGYLLVVGGRLAL